MNENQTPSGAAVPCMLAFETWAIGTRGIVFAAKAWQARAATVQAATDAGYKVTFADVTVRRAPLFDGRTEAWGQPIKPRLCYGPEAFAVQANAKRQ